MVIATRVLLDGAFNARHFGTTTPWLLRSSALDSLTPAGRETLIRLGMSRVVDLREPGEGGPASHDLEVVRVPLYHFADGVPSTGRIESIYARLLDERGEAIAEAVAAIADAPGPVAVHCTIGKDRTGVVVALALLAARASEADVLADYVLSGPEVLPHRRAFVERLLDDLALDEAERGEAWRLQVQSPPEAMQFVFSRLDSAGGAAEYLRSHGLTAAQLTALRDRVSRG